MRAHLKWPAVLRQKCLAWFIPCCLLLAAPPAKAFLNVLGDTNAYTTCWFNATNHLNAILPDNFDLEGTWRLDSSYGHANVPQGPSPNNLHFIGQRETEHYGVDTMTLKRIGSEVVPPDPRSPGAMNQIFYSPYYSSSRVLSPFADRIIVYHYTGTLTHRVSIGCGDSYYYTAPATVKYVPPTSSFIQDVDYQLTADLELHFDKDGSFMWSTFVFNGHATNAPAYPEIPTDIAAERKNARSDFTGDWPTWLASKGVAPYLGVYQDPSGDAITFEGGPVYEFNGLPYAVYSYFWYWNQPMASVDGDYLNVPELEGCTFPPLSPGGTPNPPVPPQVKQFGFGATDFTAGPGGPYYYFSTVLWRRVANVNKGIPTASIYGQLQDAQTHLTIKRGQVLLYQQNSTLSPKTEVQTTADYNNYVVSNSTCVASTIVDNSGYFSFTNVSLFKKGNTSAGLSAALYSVISKNAEADFTLDTNNPITYFQDGCATNLIPQTSPPITPVPLLTLADLGVKRNLAGLLAQLVYSNYGSDENGVIGDINFYLANPGSITPAQKEGVKRAIWSERVLQEGATQAKQFLPDMLKPLAATICNVIDSLAPTKQSRGVQGQKFLDLANNNDISQINMANFKLPVDAVGALPAVLIEDGQTFGAFGLIDSVLGGLRASLNTGFLYAGYDQSTAAKRSSAIFDGIKYMLAAIRALTDNSKSTVPPGTSFIIGKALEAAVPSLFDNSSYPFSFGSLTRSNAENSRVWMENWTNHDDTIYLASVEDTAGLINNMVNRGTTIRQRLLYSQAISDSAGQSSKVLGGIGKVTGQAYFTAAAKGADITEKIFTAANFVVPAVYIYGELPGAISNGVGTAFGHPNSQVAALSLEKKGSGPMVNSLAVSTTGLSNDLSIAYNQVTASISNIVSGLGTNHFGLVMTQMAYATPTFGHAVAAWQKAASHIRLATATCGNSSLPPDFTMSFSVAENKTGLLADGFDYELIGMMSSVVSGAYHGPTDNVYLADRTSALADAQTLLATLQKQFNNLASLMAGTDFSQSQPILDISLSLPVSLVTTSRWVTVSNEMFTLTSHVANISSVTVSNVSLQLSIQGPDGYATNVSASVLPASPINLAPNDSVAGSGADEADVTWQIKYTGPIDSATVSLIVTALENNTNTVSFIADSQTRTLEVNPDIQDSDNDGIPDDWTQKYFGHPTGMAADKSRPQDDADGDGLTNLQEYQNGTNPLLADTDGDGLTDKEEITGSKTGVVTDPLNPDTDGDGLVDGADPAPLDPIGTGAVTRPAVSLSLSSQAVTLSAGNYSASIQVTNSTGGDLTWTASLQGDAPIQITPSSPSVGGNGDTLSVSLSPLFDFTQVPPSQVTVQVTPSGLSQGAAKTLTINLAGTLGVVTSGVPVIAVQPQGATIATNSSLQLNVTAGGGAPLSYQWQFNNAAIAGATNASVTINAPKSGSYRVIVKNTLGSVTSSNATVVVYVAAGITSQPQGTNLIVGGGTTLKVTAVGSTPLRFQWTLNGTPLAGQTNASLILAQVKAANAGTYTVTVSNLYSSALSSTAVVEVIPPAPVILSPPDKFSTNGAAVLVKGTAAATAGTTVIQYTMNGGGTNAATGVTNWQAAVTLEPGTNTLAVWAVNPSGSSSKASRHYFRTVTNGVTLKTNGFGKITAGFKGTNLLDGVNYTVTAAASPNNLFSNWVGGPGLPYSVLGQSPALTFRMQSNLVLQANFVTNVFLAAQGAYNGLFSVTGPPRAQSNSGAFTFNLTGTGSLSGKLWQGSNALTLNGKFDVSGAAQISSPRNHATPLTTTLQLDFADESVAGTVSDGSFTAQLAGDRNIFTTGHPASLISGAYTVTMPGTDDPTIGPFGTGNGTVKVDTLGNLTFAGSLADGTAVSQSSAVSKDGLWPFYVPLYGGNGSVWGWNYVSNRTIGATLGFSWINATNKSKTALYRSGFTNQAAPLTGMSYSATNVPLLKLSNGVVRLAGGGLVTPVVVHVNISANNLITVTNVAEKTNKLTLTINKATGQISGSFANPANAKQIIPINGVVLQGATNAAGYFSGTNQSGTFNLSPP